MLHVTRSGNARNYVFEKMLISAPSCEIGVTPTEISVYITRRDEDRINKFNLLLAIPPELSTMVRQITIDVVVILDSFKLTNSYLTQHFLTQHPGKLL